MYDEQTLSFYAEEASTYAAMPPAAERGELSNFLNQLTREGLILELGCGSGYDATLMLARGFSVDPTDGSPEMARQAEARLGRPVRVLPFDQLDARGEYDGVWASACLLHVPRPALSSVLARVHAALVPGGLFFASYKEGSGEGRDGLGRYYNYPSAVELEAIYRAAADWGSLQIERRDGSGYDRKPTSWLSAWAWKA